MRGTPPAEDRIQTVAPEGWAAPDHMRPLGPEPTLSTKVATISAPPSNQPKTIYTPNAQDCPPGYTVGYGEDVFFAPDRKTFNATGYGAPPKENYSPQQRRLLTMRAAQLDAMRNLTEQVYGMKVMGNTTVGDMVLENDRTRVMIDYYLKGAYVVMGSPLEDGSYEATVQLTQVQPLLRKLRNEAIRPRCVHIEDLVKKEGP